MPPSAPSPIFTATDLMLQVNEDFAERLEAKERGEIMGPKTGLEKLDRALGGWLRPGLFVIHGAPGVGKSAFTLQVATECFLPTLYVSCEMMPKELFMRVMARYGSASLSVLRSTHVQPNWFTQAAIEAEKVAQYLTIWDARKVQPPIKALEAELLANPRRLVVLDSLNAWGLGVYAGKQEYEAMNTSIAALQGLAAAAEVPILVIAERNRASMSSGGMHASAGTRRVEYGAEAVLSLSFDGENEEDPDERRPEAEVTLRISKNRLGSPFSKIPLIFNSHHQEFRQRTP